MNPTCATCAGCSTWKGLGTHQVNHKPDKLVRVDICIKAVDGSAAIARFNRRFRPTIPEKLPSWCPGYFWDGEVKITEKTEPNRRLSTMESLRLAGLEDKLV